MGTRKQFHVAFKPRGVADTVDGDNSPPGACAALTNLIQDPGTPNTFICRPANTVLINFSSLPGTPGTPGVVTAAYQVGDIIYGLIGITAGTYSGKDYPFAYNTITSAFLTVSGITLVKTPTSQATSGAWTPPQMTLTGVLLVTTHIGFPGGVGAFFGWFDVTTPTLPSWNTGNTTANALPSVPQGAGSFNNRTYFLCKNVAYYTDTLSLNMTNSNQSLTIDDYTNVTCVSQLPVGTTSQGIVQGLLFFKLSKIYLLTGDAVYQPGLGGLALNLLSPSVGTAAPRSVVSTPEGVRFMALDGIRLINFYGVVSEPNDDLAIPFINAVTPSRVAAGFNSDIYRICVQNGLAVNSPFQDYWYNIHRRTWTGPHSFQYDLAIPLDNDFAIASNAVVGKMWDSFVVQGHAGTGNTFTENGVALSWVYQTCPMTDLDNLYANSVLRTTIELGAPASGQTYNFVAQDANGSALATATISESSSQAIWGAFNWGGANWGASTSGLSPATIPWNQAVVFNRLSVRASGPSALGLKIGTVHNGYKRLNYLLN